MNLESIINNCEENQHTHHISSCELEAFISHEVQRLYDAVVDALDFNLLFHGHGSDWIRNGHKTRIITCLDYSIKIKVQRIYSKKLKESHMIYISFLLPFIHSSTESLIDILKTGNRLSDALKAQLKLPNNIISSGKIDMLSILKSLYIGLVSSKNKKYKVFFSVFGTYQHASCDFHFNNSLLYLDERKRWCNYEKPK